MASACVAKRPKSPLTWFTVEAAVVEAVVVEAGAVVVEAGAGVVEAGAGAGVVEAGVVD